MAFLGGEIPGDYLLAGIAALERFLHKVPSTLQHHSRTTDLIYHVSTRQVGHRSPQPTNVPSMESINTSFLEKPHGFKQKLEAKKIHLYAVKKQSSSLRIQSSNREPQSICRGRSGDDAPKATSGGGSPTMKQEEGLFVEGTPVPELPKQPTPVSSTLSATNPYADLAPARKRKRQTDQEIPVKKEILPSQDTSVPTTQYERAFETGRPFAPAKKRVQGPRPVPDAV